jgi:hypothetical protein
MFVCLWVSIKLNKSWNTRLLSLSAHTHAHTHTRAQTHTTHTHTHTQHTHTHTHTTHTRTHTHKHTHTRFCHGGVALGPFNQPHSRLIVISIQNIARGGCGWWTQTLFSNWWLALLYAHRHRSILGAAGHIILTPANQLMVMGLKIWSLSNPASNQRPFDHWPSSLPTALTGPNLTYVPIPIGTRIRTAFGRPMSHSKCTLRGRRRSLKSQCDV